MANIIDQTESKIEELLQRKATTTEETLRLLEEAEEELKKAEEACRAATVTGETAEYIDAEREAHEASVKIKLRDARLNMLQNDPLVTEQEYKDTIAAIQEYFTAQEAALIEKASSMVEELEPLLAAYNDMYDKATRILKRWQHDIYKDIDKPIDSHGNRVGPDKRLKTTGTAAWVASFIQGSPQHKRKLVFPSPR